MLFALRTIHIGFWLFVAWVALRVWELNFEVSPLPAWMLPLAVFIALFAIAFWLARRLQKRHPLDARHVFWAGFGLVGSALLWEMGLTVYLGGWSALPSLFSWRFLVGMGMEALAVAVAAWTLRRQTARLSGYSPGGSETGSRTPVRSDS